MNNVCLVGGIGKANNISNLQYKIKANGKWDICDNKQLEGIVVNLKNMKILVKVIYLPMQAFI